METEPSSLVRGAMEARRGPAKPCVRFHRMVALVAFALVLASGAPALADARSEARAHYRSGMQLIDRGRYEEGANELIAAYETLPHPNVLSNIARAYALAGRFEDSIAYFERYLESGPRDADAIEANLRELRAALAASTPVPAEAQVTEATTEATETLDVTMDAERRSLLDAAQQLDDLARVTGSAALASRAAEMRRLADLVEARRAAAAESAQAEATESATAGSAEAAADESAVALEGADAADATTYDETVEGASRSSSNPLDAPASTTIITRQDIHLSGASSLTEILRRAAGVNVVLPIANNGNVAIRGFNRPAAARVLMLINGRSTYLDVLGVPLWEYQTIQLDDIERIEIIRGPASVIYGANGFTGIVNIVTRQAGGTMANEMSASGGNASQLRGTGSVSGRVGSVMYRVHAGFSQGNRFALPFDTRRVDVTIPVENLGLGYRHTNAGVQVRTLFGRSGELAFEGGIGYSDRITFAGSGAFKNFIGKYVTAHAMATLSSDFGRLRVFYNHFDADVDLLGNVVTGSNALNDAVDVEGSIHQRFHLVVDHDLHVGANFRYTRVDWGYIGEKPIARNLFGAFFEDTMKAGDFVRLVASLRIDHHPLVDHLIYSPRGAIVLRPSETTSIRLTAGTAFRTPSYLDAFVDLPVETPVSAVNARFIGGGRTGVAVEPERIRSFEVGFADETSRFVAFDVAAYYNIVTNLLEVPAVPELVPLATYAAAPTGPSGFVADRNAFIVGNVSLSNQGDAYHSTGGEVSVHTYPTEGLDVYANYSLNLTRVNPVVGVSTWDRRTSQHMGNLGAQYRSRVGVDASADLHASSRQVWPETYATSTGVERIRFPQPAFFLLNARVGYRFSADRFEAAISGFNITRMRHRQHPLGEPLDVRVLATFTVRMSES